MGHRERKSDEALSTKSTPVENSEIWISFLSVAEEGQVELQEAVKLWSKRDRESLMNNWNKRKRTSRRRRKRRILHRRRQRRTVADEQSETKNIPPPFVVDNNNNHRRPARSSRWKAGGVGGRLPKILSLST